LANHTDNQFLRHSSLPRGPTNTTDLGHGKSGAAPDASGRVSQARSRIRTPKSGWTAGRWSTCKGRPVIFPEKTLMTYICMCMYIH